MGALGGLFLIFVILLIFMFAGFYNLTNGIADKARDLKDKVIPKRAVKGQLDKQQKLNVITNHLDGLGFFEVSSEEKIFMDIALSQAIGECSTEPGFFWDINAQGIRVKPNRDHGQYNYWLIYSNNRIGFNWQGSA